MVVSHGVMLTIVVAALVCLSCVVAVMVRTPAPRFRRAQVRRARVRRARVRRADADRADADSTVLRRLDLADIRRVPEDAPLPPLDQVTAELHRLHRQRVTGSTYGSQVWHTAVADAYDEWLQVACHYLAVSQHLAKLDGMDRDLERLRVEAELSAAGLRLPPRPAG